MTARVSPAVTVIITTQEADAHIARCLESLARQTLQPEAEIIVSGGAPKQLKTALEQARGNIVAVTDSRCLFPSNWLEELREAHDSVFNVIGGAVAHGGPDTLVAWAMYFSDYGPFMLPARRRENSFLAGNHVSYKRSVIRESLVPLKDGYWKVFLHADLDRQRIRFLFDPRLVVTRLQTETFREFTRRYYRNGYEFAAARALRISFTARLLRLVTIPALPPLLLYRRANSVWGKKTNRLRLVASLPLLIVFVTFWSAGEMAGYVRGITQSKASL